MIRRFLDWLDPHPQPYDSIGDLRPALGALVKRAMREGDFTLKIWDCVINDVPVGDWEFAVSRIQAQAGEAGRPKRGVTRGSVHEHAVAESDAPK